MSPWDLAAAALAATLGATGLASLRGGTLDRLVAVQLFGVLAPLGAVVLAVASGRDRYLVVAVALSILTLAGSLAYGRFLERWL